MRPHAFTDEEVKVLRENKYTAFVSNNSIRFTLEFKEMFLEKKKEGVPVRRIFLEAGYDVNILGTSRIKNLSKRIPKEASSPCGLHEGYHIHSKRPEDADTAAWPRKKPWPPCSVRLCTCARSLAL